MKIRLAAGIAGVLMVVAAGACGDDSEGRPSKSELSESIVEAVDVEKAVGDCIADRLLDSDLSDETLQAIAEEDDSDLGDEEREEAIEVIGTASADCAAGG
jgi:hypothetical protein